MDHTDHDAKSGTDLRERTQLLIDGLLPSYNARLIRQADFPQSPQVVRAALEEVTFPDLPALKFLLRVRTFGRKVEQDREPIFAGMRHADYVYVEQNDTEIAAAMAGPLWDLREPFRPLSERDAVLHTDPGWAVTVTSYRTIASVRGTRLICETRVGNPTEPAAARRFWWYWRVAGRIGATVYARNLEAAVRRRLGALRA